MKPRGPVHALLASASMLGSACAARAWAQTAPTPALPRGGGAASPGDSAGGGAVVAVVIAVLVILGLVVKISELKRKREAEAVHLQAQISDALLREPALVDAPITPSARVPIWRRSPAVIEIAGQVPSGQAREAALRIVRAEASRIRPDFRIEDRLSVVPRQVA
jgi:hypothetical protein